MVVEIMGMVDLVNPKYWTDVVKTFIEYWKIDSTPILDGMCKRIYVT